MGEIGLAGPFLANRLEKLIQRIDIVSILKRSEFRVAAEFPELGIVLL